MSHRKAKFKPRRPAYVPSPSDLDWTRTFLANADPVILWTVPCVKELYLIHQKRREIVRLRADADGRTYEAIRANFEMLGYVVKDASEGRPFSPEEMVEHFMNDYDLPRDAAEKAARMVPPVGHGMSHRRGRIEIW